MAIKYTTEDSTRFRLDADCYGHAGEGYLKKGAFLEVPKDTPISATWTEVDADGEPVPGGHSSRKISRLVERPKGSTKSIAEMGAEEPDAENDDAEAAPTPPAAPAKAKPAAKPAAPAKAKRS